MVIPVRIMSMMNMPAPMMTAVSLRTKGTATPPIAAVVMITIAPAPALACCAAAASVAGRDADENIAVGVSLKHGIHGGSKRLGIGHDRPEIKYSTAHVHRLRDGGRADRDLHVIGHDAGNRSWRIIAFGRCGLRRARRRRS